MEDRGPNLKEGGAVGWEEEEEEEDRLWETKRFLEGDLGLGEGLEGDLRAVEKFWGCVSFLSFL